MRLEKSRPTRTDAVKAALYELLEFGWVYVHPSYVSSITSAITMPYKIEHISETLVKVSLLSK